MMMAGMIVTKAEMVKIMATMERATRGMLATTAPITIGAGKGKMSGITRVIAKEVRAGLLLMISAIRIETSRKSHTEAMVVMICPDS
jgi:hypothetical protein